ncbi:unnamed protein product [Discula destructiva]
MPHFSVPVSQKLVQQSGSRTTFPTIIHQDHDAFTKAAEAMQHEYNQAMETSLDVRTVSKISGIGYVHPIALTIPHCLPERVAAVTRFAEFTILNDDYYDLANRVEIENVNNDIQGVLEDYALATGNAKPTASATNTTKSKLFQASLFLDLMNIDQELALEIMNSYSDGLDVATFAPDQVKDLEEYFPIRKINSGLEVTSHLACFAMGFKLSQQERDVIRDIEDQAMYAVTVINDLYSWPKEVKCHLETPGSERPFNAVAILMRHGGYSETEAFEVLRQKQSELEGRHMSLLTALRARLQREGTTLSENQDLFLQTMQAAASGSELWSIHTQRYPSKEDLGQPEVEFVDNAFRYKVDGVDTASVYIEEQGALKLDALPIRLIQQPATPPASDSICSDRSSSSSSFETCESQEQMKADVDYVNRHTESAEKIVCAPFEYISTLPSKGVRNTFIDSLNVWLEVPEASLQTIKTIVGRLHDSSLMLDDIEDDSTLRRGHPAAHVVYGTAQTINAANYLVVLALNDLQKLQSPQGIIIFTEELRTLFLGQGSDLHWKYHVELPSEEQYMEMIDNKTGGLFRLCVRLMQAESTRTDLLHLNPRHFVRQLSLYFQIRDDYQNLSSDQYAKQKGWAEDLDEGKISLPLIYTLQAPNSARSEILGIFRKKQPGPLPMEVKQYLMTQIKKSGALELVYSQLQVMQRDLMEELKRLETEFGNKNPTLEILLRKLWVN